jgi:hypothetical protein
MDYLYCNSHQSIQAVKRTNHRTIAPPASPVSWRTFSTMRGHSPRGYDSCDAHKAETPLSCDLKRWMLSREYRQDCRTQTSNSEIQQPIIAMPSYVTRAPPVYATSFPTHHNTTKRINTASQPHRAMPSEFKTHYSSDIEALASNMRNDALRQFARDVKIPLGRAYVTFNIEDLNTDLITYMKRTRSEVRCVSILKYPKLTD